MNREKYIDKFKQKLQRITGYQWQMWENPEDKRRMVFSPTHDKEDGKVISFWCQAYSFETMKNIIDKAIEDGLLKNE